MTDDQSTCGKASLERRRHDLIRATEDPHFRASIYRLAYRLTGEKMEAEDCSQEALARFISTVKNKTLDELEHMNSPLAYVRVIVHNVCKDRWRKMYQPAPQEEQQDASEVGRQRIVLLAAHLSGPVKDEEDQLGSTGLGVEELVVSEMLVETFIKSLPEELRELARLLIYEEYQLHELTGILKQSYNSLRERKRRIRAALIAFQQQNIQKEAIKVHGR